jgi:hypothetical protein
MINPALMVGLGEVLWDLLPSGKVLGGAPANFAYMANVLGDEGIVASRVGNDDLGYEACRAMQQLGLSTSYPQHDYLHTTGTARVAIDQAGQPNFTIAESVSWISWNGQKTGRTYRGGLTLFASVRLPAFAEVRRYDRVLFAKHAPRRDSEYAMSTCVRPSTTKTCCVDVSRTQILSS